MSRYIWHETNEHLKKRTSWTSQHDPGRVAHRQWRMKTSPTRHPAEPPTSPTSSSIPEVRCTHHSTYPTPLSPHLESTDNTGDIRKWHPPHHSKPTPMEAPRAKARPWEPPRARNHKPRDKKRDSTSARGRRRWQTAPPTHKSHNACSSTLRFYLSHVKFVWSNTKRCLKKPNKGSVEFFSQ